MLRSTLRRAMGPGWKAGRRRWLTVFEDDVMLVSYPRSGNTWARFLLAALRDPDHPPTFEDIRNRVPEVYRPDSELRKIPRPRILKSHEYLDPRYQRVIYLVRHPVDVAVSYYWLKVRAGAIDPSQPMDGFVQRFVTGELDPYGTWSDHVGGWLGARDGTAGFCLVRFEELKGDTKRALERMARLASMDVSHDRLDEAVVAADASRIQDLHRQHTATGSPSRQMRSDVPFIHSGRSGAGQSELSDEARALLHTRFGHVMDELGY